MNKTSFSVIEISLKKMKRPISISPLKQKINRSSLASPNSNYLIEKRLKNRKSSKISKNNSYEHSPKDNQGHSLDDRKTIILNTPPPLRRNIYGKKTVSGKVIIECFFEDANWTKKIAENLLKAKDLFKDDHYRRAEFEAIEKYFESNHDNKFTHEYLSKISHLLKKKDKNYPLKRKNINCTEIKFDENHNLYLTLSKNFKVTKKYEEEKSPIKIDKKEEHISLKDQLKMRKEEEMRKKELRLKELVPEFYQDDYLNTNESEKKTIKNEKRIHDESLIGEEEINENVVDSDSLDEKELDIINRMKTKKKFHKKNIFKTKSMEEHIMDKDSIFNKYEKINIKREKQLSINKAVLFHHKKDFSVITGKKENPTKIRELEHIGGCNIIKKFGKRICEINRVEQNREKVLNIDIYSYNKELYLNDNKDKLTKLKKETQQWEERRDNILLKMLSSKDHKKNKVLELKEMEEKNRIKKLEKMRRHSSINWDPTTQKIPGYMMFY